MNPNADECFVCKPIPSSCACGCQQMPMGATSGSEPTPSSDTSGCNTMPSSDTSGCNPMPCFDTSGCKPAWICSPSKSDKITEPGPVEAQSVTGPEPVEADDDPGDKGQCNPMPCFDTEMCKPSWLCSPPKSELKKYPMPDGVTVKPISQTGKYLLPDSSDLNTGTMECEASNAPKIYKTPEGVTILPLSKTGKNQRSESAPQPGSSQPGTCEPKPEKMECPGVFSRIASMFCSDEDKAAPAESSCPTASSEPEACDCGCGSADEKVTAQQFLEKKCECSACMELQRASVLLVCLPEPDSREIGIRSQELLATLCGCYRCNSSPSKGEDPECPCGGITCGECGCRRGDNDSCKMCRFAVQMKVEAEYLERRRQFCVQNYLEDDTKPNIERSVDLDQEPFQWSKGQIVYEGGMTLDRSQRFLWERGSRQGEGYRSYALKGQVLRKDDDDDECTCEEHLRKKRYRGGMTLDETQEYLWIKNKLVPPAINQDLDS